MLMLLRVYVTAILSVKQTVNVWVFTRMFNYQGKTGGSIFKAEKVGPITMLFHR